MLDALAELSRKRSRATDRPNRPHARGADRDEYQRRVRYSIVIVG